MTSNMMIRGEQLAWQVVEVVIMKEVLMLMNETEKRFESLFFQ